MGNTYQVFSIIEGDARSQQKLVRGLSVPKELREARRQDGGY
jgi:hypothetical protein